MSKDELAPDVNEKIKNEITQLLERFNTLTDKAQDQAKKLMNKYFNEKKNLNDIGELEKLQAELKESIVKLEAKLKVAEEATTKEAEEATTEEEAKLKEAEAPEAIKEGGSRRRKTKKSKRRKTKKSKRRKSKRRKSKK